MAGIAHIGVGLALKPMAPKAPLWIFIVAAEAIDLLWGIFALAKIEDFVEAPWSHGLLMSVVWSTVAGFLTARIYHSRRTGILIGLVVFSHWVIDFISHPMTGGPADLPLLFAGSPKVGLGLYSAISPLLAGVIEIGSVVIGLALLLISRKGARVPAGV